MKLNLFSQEKEKHYSVKDLVNEGFTEIIEDVYLGQDEIACEMCGYYKKYPFEKLSTCRIERRVHHYNLHIEGEYLNYCSTATLSEVQQAASKISDAASKKGHSISVKTGCMKVNLMEAMPFSFMENADSFLGCLGIILLPVFAIIYYITFPLLNIILRLFIK